MLLDDAWNATAENLQHQADLGVQITVVNEVPEQGPENKGLWLSVDNVTAVFVDLSGSTKLNFDAHAQTAARAYTYFITPLVSVAQTFQAQYVEVQGDAVFALFSGPESAFSALAFGITSKTMVEGPIAAQFSKDTTTDWKLKATIGVDRSKLLVRRLGIRGTKKNEVWAGQAVSVAAKLSNVASPGELVASPRVFEYLDKAGALRHRVLFATCGCDRASGTEGKGLDALEDSADLVEIWSPKTVSEDLGLSYTEAHCLTTKWCETHGSEFCETLVSGTRPTNG